MRPSPFRWSAVAALFLVPSSTGCASVDTRIFRQEVSGGRFVEDWSLAVRGAVR